MLHSTSTANLIEINSCILARFVSRDISKATETSHVDVPPTSQHCW
jgi:hypothetical protein